MTFSHPFHNLIKRKQNVNKMMIKNDAGDVVRKSRFSRLWGVHSKLVFNHGLHMSVDTEIKNFIKTFIIDDINGKMVSKLELVNIMFGRWKYSPLETSIANSIVFLKRMDTIYTNQTVDFWIGCFCPVQSYEEYFQILPTWAIEYNRVDTKKVIEDDAVYWVSEPILVQASEPILVQASEPILVQAPEPILVQASEPILVQAPELIAEQAPEPILVQAPELIAEQPNQVTLRRRSQNWTNHYESIIDFRDTHLKQNDNGIMLYSELYYTYFSGQLTDKSTIIEKLTDSEFLETLTILFGIPKKGIWYGWYIAYDYDYTIYWSNHFDKKNFLPRHISILNLFFEFRNRRDAFENSIRMMYNNQSVLLVVDKEFIKSVVTMFFSYRSDLSKCFSKFTKNKRYNIICSENDRISNNVSILYRLLFRPAFINKTIIDLTLEDIQVQVPTYTQVQTQVLIPVSVPCPDPVSDSTPLPIQIPVQVQVPVPNSTPLPTQDQSQDSIQDFTITPLDIDRSIERIIRKRSMIDLICVTVCKLLRESDGIDQDDEYKRMKLQHRINNE